MFRRDTVLIALYVGPVLSACAPLPTNETAVLYSQSTLVFPFALLDFGSADVRIFQVDGKIMSSRRVIELTPGRHSIVAEARKGPSGYFGVTAFLGRCQGKLEIDVQAGRSYSVKFESNGESEVIQFLDKTTAAVISHAKCVP